MILFKSITYKNFKAVGNSPVTINLNKDKTTLITGKNGAGKSTLKSALAFGLFGQDIVLNKNGLINSINLKQTEVVIEFSVDKKEYKIVRGIKPNIFKIFENGKLLNEDAATRDYQKILETQILKMDIRAFKQVVIVGGRDYVPFMKLKSNDRREFIEDLLDIRVLSTMGSLLKDKVKTLKDEIKENDDALKSLKEQIALQKSFVEKLTNEKSISVNKIEESIRGIATDNENITKQVDALLLLEDEKVKKSIALKNSGEWLSNLIYERKKANDSLNRELKSKKFFAEESSCPICFQEIGDEHKKNVGHSIESQITIAESELLELHTKIINCEKLVSKYAAWQDEITNIQVEVRKLQSRIQTNLHVIERSQEQIVELNSDNTSIDVEKDKLRTFASKYMACVENKKVMLEEKQYNELKQELLADDGIKAKIIKQHIPTINKYVNFYLEKFDFFISYHLDENFNESIKSRHRDTFTYENFSDGQQARIDLSLMLAWREVARTRNAVNTNLLILDEADASVDAEGAELLNEVLKTFNGCNIFIISHKGDLLRDKVDDVIVFELQNNFTVSKQ